MTVGFGDLARTMPLTRQGVQTRADLARLSQELTTGRHADLAGANRGDLRAAAGIERNLTVLASAEQAAQSVQHRMTAMQAGLDTVSEAAGQAARDLIALSEPAADAASGRAADSAEAALGAVVSALGARMGGINLFSGTASDRSPLPGPDEMLTSLRASLATPGPAPATAADLATAVEAWFAPGGGMDVAFPVPGSDIPATLTVAPGETLRVDATAADPALRGIMAELAVGVLAADLTDAGERRGALRAAGTGLLGDEAGLANLQSRLGIAEGQSERALTRVRAETNALEIARGEVMEVDRYETATKFQAAEAAVETLYLVTSRLSGLSLANYIR